MIIKLCLYGGFLPPHHPATHLLESRSEYSFARLACCQGVCVSRLCLNSASFIFTPLPAPFEHKDTCVLDSETVKFAPQGGQGRLVPPPPPPPHPRSLSGILGLSFDSSFLSPLTFFCRLILLLFLSCHFCDNGPFS